MFRLARRDTYTPGDLDPIPSEDQTLIDNNRDAGQEPDASLGVRGSFPAITDVRDPVGDIPLGSADAQHREILDALNSNAAATAAILSELGMDGFQIIRLDAGAAPVPLSQHIRMRVLYVIVNPVTAGTLTLTLGTGTYPFDGAARSLTYIPFPIVIERGTDMSCVGTDGRIYLIGQPE